MDEKAQKVLDQILAKEVEARGTDSLAVNAPEEALSSRLEKILEKYSEPEAEDLLGLLNAVVADEED